MWRTIDGIRSKEFRGGVKEVTDKWNKLRLYGLKILPQIEDAYS